MIRVGVIGLGFIGAVHCRAYRAAAESGAPVRLVAVCDQDPRRRRGEASEEGNISPIDEGPCLFEPDAVTAYEQAADLLADSEVDLVSICTSTETHVDLAMRALAAGKHVLVEKPLALTADAARPLIDAARASDRLCMPALCMRFWPGWDWLHERVREGTFGAVLGASFQRLGSRPRWGRGFYEDARRSGGALVDLHTHDVDFICWLFGRPTRVKAAGSIDDVITLYEFADGPARVSAEGTWRHEPGLGFRMRYTVVFEGATADFDLSRDPKLIVARGAAREAVPVQDSTGWELEVQALLRAIESRAAAPPVTVEDAFTAVEVIDAERRSLESGEVAAVNG